MKSIRRFLICLAAGAASLSAFANTATEPAPRPAADGRFGGDAFLKRHEEFLQVARAGGIDILFLGDSLTDMWRETERGGVPRGKPVWDKYFAPMHAANFGIGGDRTQNILWRIDHGELDQIHPKVIVLLIGTNNLGTEHDTGQLRNTTAEAIAGITAVVHSLRAKRPDSKILLLGVFPRGEKDEAIRAQVAAVNAQIAHLDDRPHVYFLDLAPQFLQPDGNFRPGIMADKLNLHPNVRGYEIWAKAIQEPLRELLR